MGFNEVLVFVLGILPRPLLSSGGRGLAAAGTNQRRLMPDEFRQWRNHALASDAILEVIPEVDPQLPAGFLQARKRVSATPSRVTAGTATDFPFLHVVA